MKKYNSNLKKIKTCTIFIIFIVMIVSHTITAETSFKISEPLETYAQSLTNKEPTPRESKIIHIFASSFYDYGYKVGGIIPIPRITFKLIEQDFENKSINISNIKKYSPFYYEMLQGFCDRLNIPLVESIYLQKLINLFYKSDACTIILSTNPSTKNNETFLSQSLDSSKVSSLFWRPYFSYIMYVAHIENYYSYAFNGIPIFYELRILNEKGLGWGGNFISVNSTRLDSGEGMYIYELELRTMLNCSTVKEIKNLWNKTKRSSGPHNFPDLTPKQSDNSAEGYCDSQGGILVIEQMHNNFIALNGTSTDKSGTKPGILWHTNHHIWLDPNLTGSKYPWEYPSSWYRANRSQELLEINYGNIDLEMYKNFTRDHAEGYDPNKPDSGDICRHSDNRSGATTLIAWIVEPKKLTMHWTHGQPCESEFETHNFTEDFEKNEKDVSQVNMVINNSLVDFFNTLALHQSLLNNKLLSNNKLINILCQ